MRHVFRATMYSKYQDEKNAVRKWYLYCRSDQAPSFCSTVRVQQVGPLGQNCNPRPKAVYGYCVSNKPNQFLYKNIQYHFTPGEHLITRLNFPLITLFIVTYIKVLAAVRIIKIFTFHCHNNDQFIKIRQLLNY